MISGILMAVGGVALQLAIIYLYLYVGFNSALNHIEKSYCSRFNDSYPFGITLLILVMAWIMTGILWGKLIIC